MSGARPTTDMPPIELEPWLVGRLPLPEAKELPADSAWKAWDDAVQVQDEVV